ncbi:MAG: hypothetical protein O6952_08240, partial [Planctomycetota bacterium]|nr:hypothetical protein [Planctomycetota bacterium]
MHRLAIGTSLPRSGRTLLSACILLLILTTCTSGSRDRLETVAQSPIRVPRAYFTANHGQLEPKAVSFYHSSADLLVGFSKSSVLIKKVDLPETPPASGGEIFSHDPSSVVRGVLVALTFPGANPTEPVGRERLPFLSHYLIGNDRAKWTRDVPSYGEVIYSDLYDGIDLIYRAAEDGLKYEFHVAPGADPALIEISYEGAEDLRIGASGELIIGTDVGPLRDSPPIVFIARTGGSVLSQTPAQQAEPKILGRYVLRSLTSVGFEVEGWDGTSPLVIDPLVYSTFVGGRRTEYIRAIVIDRFKQAHLAGWTISPDFPVTPGAFITTFTETKEGFVAKLNRNATRPMYCTFMGGNLL